MPSYITFTRMGKEEKRRKLTKREIKQRSEKVRATRAAKRAAVAIDLKPLEVKKRGRPPDTNIPEREELARLRRNLNGALTETEEGLKWLQTAWGRQLKEFDPAHICLINVRKELLKP